MDATLTLFLEGPMATTQLTSEASPDGLLAEVRSWIAATWRPELTVREWWRLLAVAGYAHPMWPSNVGGRSASAAEARVIGQALAQARVVAAPTGHLAATLAAPTILSHGTPEQIERFVGPIARGEAACCQLFSEPGGDLHRVGLGSPGNRLGGGTDEIQLNVLGERGLGLPREPGNDAELPYPDLRVGTQTNR